MIHSWETLGLHIPNLMLPKEGTDYFRWAVIACDQYTSQPGYWAKVKEIVGDSPSTLNLILPEVYLKTDQEDIIIESVQNKMQQYLSDGTLRTLKPGCILIKRTAEGRSHLGLVIALDLESYDFTHGSHSIVRPTEIVVPHRIPPRLKIREGAPIECPHILILIDDPDRTVIEPLVNQPREVIYDTDLMMDGGHITGSFISEKHLDGVRQGLSVLFDESEEKYGKGKAFLMAVGDGNHSLATAKAAWENLKQKLTPDEIEDHPARFALCEIANIHDEGLIFKSIHRVLFPKKNLSGMELVEKVVNYLNKANGQAYLADSDYVAPEDVLNFSYITKERKGQIIIENPSWSLEVECLQRALNSINQEEDCFDIDYIHGKHATEALALEKGNVGFLLPDESMSKLFYAVAVDGPLPRKTFSVGKANEKRFYIECKSITRA
ncbi:MAG TPA: DUF1015 domain-containing protein [Mogibacterium sp.]|nr:DUF1015 domain-containing protein [Mogibacterium sp.]